MKYRVIQALLSGLLLFLLSGCTFIQDPVSLMKKPELPADKATLHGAIQTALQKRKTDTGAIIRPRSDVDSSSIRIQDLDNDGVLEAVVFYQTPDEEVKIHGMIMQQQGDAWVKLLDFDGEGTVLESFDFVDFTNDGKVDIVAGFSRGEENLQNLLIVYSFSGNSLEKVAPLPYTHFNIGDLNGDKIKDITVVYLQQKELSYVSTYQYDKFEEAFVELDKLDLGPNIESYYNVVAGKVAKNKEGIILDASVISNSSYSKLIIMEDNKFVDILQDELLTFKELPIESEDVNDDGTLEIGLLERPAGWEDRLFEEIPYFTTYYQWDGEIREVNENEGLQFVLQRYYDINNHFYLDFPADLYNQITITPESNKDSYLNFVMIDSGESVAEIKFFTMAQWAEAESDWEILVKEKSRVIAYRSHGDLKLSKKENKPSNNVAPIERKGN
ncbi:MULTISPECIES: hypothetical protein [Paenibacillus]|uniref:VCBS repeat-containing protein n=1 Tax=Paenibacillus lactis TaxID=228574 RepID=A0ABS4F8W2_9BACL|nr:hypothetical protein [Paenibacillus lactis]MBP1892700.1 hypothetical protein [Paenibacillus lactis]MCM3495016.1 hypothetical protein [Paenibacillus lactis]HAF97315.1 hypothetical protein [Paenibacillus lactis]